jgi:hypothetical protein
MGEAYWCYSKCCYFFDLNPSAFVLAPVLWFVPDGFTFLLHLSDLRNSLSQTTYNFKSTTSSSLSHPQYHPRHQLPSLPILDTTSSSPTTRPDLYPNYHLYESKSCFVMVTPPEQNYQPQTRDTTNGPHLHTYIPRSDGTIVVGGIAYVPQTFGSNVTATTVPVGMAFQPTALPLPTVQLPPKHLQYPLNFPYYIYQGASSL